MLFALQHISFALSNLKVHTSVRTDLRLPSTDPAQELVKHCEDKAGEERLPPNNVVLLHQKKMCNGLNPWARHPEVQGRMAHLRSGWNSQTSGSSRLPALQPLLFHWTVRSSAGSAIQL